MALLEKNKCRYHISQLSAGKSVDVIKERKNDIKFTCGVSINNLSLNENDIGDFKTFLKLSPPLRKEEDREALVQGLKDKTIDVIVSDHKPEDEESKRLTFSQAATGASGIETLLSLSLELYHNGSVKLETIIQALTSNPAKILRIDKGNLSIGNDADFCIVDLDKPWIVKKENLISKSKNTSIEDKKLQGKVTNTFVKGKELFKDIIMDYFIVGIVSYLMGSIPFGLILTKIFLNKDIREIGSGNIGATNALRTGNKLIGYSTLILDIAKAIIPVIFVKINYPDLIYIASLCAF